MRVNSIADLAATVRGQRRELSLSQAELARRCGVSRKWLSEFESGKLTAEIGLILRVLEYLGLGLEITRAPVRRFEPGTGQIDLDAHLAKYRQP